MCKGLQIKRSCRSEPDLVQGLVNWELSTATEWRGDKLQTCNKFSSLPFRNQRNQQTFDNKSKRNTPSSFFCRYFLDSYTFLIWLDCKKSSSLRKKVQKIGRRRIVNKYKIDLDRPRLNILYDNDELILITEILSMNLIDLSTEKFLIKFLYMFS